MSVRIIDSLPELGGQLAALYPEKYIYDMPGFPKVLAKDLARQMIEQGLQFGAETVLGETAEALIVHGDLDLEILTGRGISLPTKTVLIAAGAGAFSPTKIGVAREEEFVGKGLSYGVRSLDEFRGLRVGIVGGGDSAFDWALALAPIADSVDLIHRRDQFRAHEDTIAKVRATKTEFRLFETISDLIGGDRLEAVHLLNTQTKAMTHLPLEALVVNIGYKSSLGPLMDWGLEVVKNQIVVDSQFQTCRRGVFAIGDVCSYAGKLKLIATGVGEATTAVCVAKTLLDPGAKLFPGHSSDMELPGT